MSWQQLFFPGTKLRQRELGPLGITLGGVRDSLTERVYRDIVVPHFQVRFDFLRPLTAEFDEEKQTVGELTVPNDTYNLLQETASRLRGALRVETQIHSSIHTDIDIGDPNKQQELINRMLNALMTSISITRSRNGVGGATIEFRLDARRYSPLIIDVAQDFINKWLLRPHVAVSIWSRGRIYTDRMFPRFSGMTTSIVMSNKSGFASLRVECKDTLHFLEISTYNVNPAVIPVKDPDRRDISIHGNLFWGLPSFDIIRALVLGSKIDGQSLFKPTQADINGIHAFKEIGAELQDPKRLVSISNYYNRRAIKGNDILGKRSNEQPFDHYGLVMWGRSVTVLRKLSLTTPDLFRSDRMTKQDIIKTITDRTFTEFYADGLGGYNHHPIRVAPNYYAAMALERLGSREEESIRYGRQDEYADAKVIGESDILDISISYTSEPIVTFIRLRGEFHLLDTPSELMDLVGSHYDQNLARKFGFRFKEVDNPLLNKPINDESGQPSRSLMKPLVDEAAKSYMAITNADMLNGSVTIVDRPELELAVPVLITDTSSSSSNPTKYFFLIDSISTTVQIGTSATSSLGLHFGQIVGDAGFQDFTTDYQRLVQNVELLSPTLLKVVKETT